MYKGINKVSAQIILIKWLYANWFLSFHLPIPRIKKFTTSFITPTYLIVSTTWHFWYVVAEEIDLNIKYSNILKCKILNVLFELFSISCVEQMLDLFIVLEYGFLAFRYTWSLFKNTWDIRALLAVGYYKNRYHLETYISKLCNNLIRLSLFYDMNLNMLFYKFIAV